MQAVTAVTLQVVPDQTSLKTERLATSGMGYKSFTFEPIIMFCVLLKINKIRKIYKFAFHVDQDHKINYFIG